MKNTVNQPTFRIAFCAVIAALLVVFMMLSSLIPIGTFALPCVAGILTVAVVLEFGCKWAFGVFAVAAILSVFLAGDKEAVIYYIAFFGYYPIIKSILESKISKRLLQYIVKLAVFNAAMIAAFFVAGFILSISAEEYTLFGVYLPQAFLLAGNLFFFLYDRAVTVFVVFYVRRLRDKLFGRHHSKH